MELLVFSFLFSVLLTPLSVLCAARVGALDTPDGERKRHPLPTPRLGGLAVFLSVLTAGLLFLPATSFRAALLSGGALLCVLGISDDIFSLSPSLKLLCELFIALTAVAFGVYPRTLTLGSLVLTPPIWLSILLAVLLLLLLSNAFNLIDGLDTLAVTQGLVSAAALSLYAPTSWVLFGSLLGFLPYNRRSLGLLPVRMLPTRSFLGDTGALFIGYALALFALSSSRFSLFSLLLFAVPLYDLCSSVLRRLVKKKNPFRADREHLHHRLEKKGYSPALAVLLLLLYALLFASVGVCLTMLL